MVNEDAASTPKVIYHQMGLEDKEGLTKEGAKSV
jgi:hypothetical protein